MGSKFLKIIQGNGDKSVKTKKEVIAELPEGCIAYGIATDFELAGKVLRTALLEQGITDKKAVVTVSSPDMIVKELALPKITDKNMDRIVAAEMDVYLSDDRYAIDYIARNAGDGIKALVFGIDRNIMENYRAMLAAAGLTPMAMDIHANAVRKLVAVTGCIPSLPSDVCILTDIGADLMNFHFFVEGELVYTRCVSVGMDVYAKANIDQMRGKTAQELQEDINFNTYISLLGDEIQKMLQFKATGEFKSLGAKIFLSGGGAKFEGIGGLLGDYLNVETSVLDTKILLNALGAQIRV